MRALLYLTKRSFINRARKAVRKPVTYLYIALGIFYVVGILAAFASLAAAGGIAYKQGIVYVMTVWLYFIFCSNFLSYAKLKGVIFRPSHAHFIFTAPISSKLVLLHGAILNYTVSLVADFLFSVAAVTIFHVEPVRAILLFVFCFVFETAFETSLMVFLYSGEERFQGLIRLLRLLIYVLVGAVAAVVAWYLVRGGLNKESVLALFESPALRLLPVAGWEVSAVSLLVTGPDRWNVIGTVLFLLACAGMLLVARRIRCTGAYYEDAAKFADDYAELKRRNQKGENSVGFGKKKLKKASLAGWGTGAKAIFSRQLLEYKKERFFIFTGFTLAALIGSVACIFFVGRPDEELPPDLLLMGIAIYMVFVGTGYMGKWGKELELPYIYLIPEPAAKKLWYATCTEHLKALVDAVIFCVPVGLAWGISIWKIAAIILSYVVLQANRLYIKVLGDSLLGDTLGTTGKQFFLLGVQGGILGIGALASIPAAYLINANLLFLIVPIYSMIITVLIAALTVPRFECMEQWD